MNTQKHKVQWLPLILALYLLNVCVDVQDLNTFNGKEDLSINDQESLLELIVEQVAGFDDCFSEYDDPDSKDQNKKKTSSLQDLFYPSQLSNNHLAEIPMTALHDSPDDHSGFTSLVDPPPICA